jgi:hypothetical protein
MIDKAWSYFMESDHKFSKKFLHTLIIIILLLCIDYFFRFSDSYIAEKKIEQIGKIQEIMKQDSLSAEPKRELLKLQTQVIKRQGFWELSSDLMSFIHSTISSPNAIKTRPINAKPIKDSVLTKDMPPIQVLGSQSFDSKNYKRSVTWHVITSCWMLIILMLAMPFVLFQKDENKISFGAFIANVLLLILLITLYSFLLALIPVYENPLLNYLINFLSMPFFLLIYAIIDGLRLSRKILK